MEVMRTTDGAGQVHQWYEAQRAMVIDTVTGQPERTGFGGLGVVTMERALEIVKARPGCEGRLVIVKLDCIVAGPV